jgi:predicted transcriptional regulator
VSKVKVTISIERELSEALSEYAAKAKTSRSHVIEEALRQWQRWERERKLVEGYRAMREESVEMAEADLPAGLETWSRS